MKQFLIAVFATVTVFNTASVYADAGDQLAKLLAKDGAAEDQFGRAVAISGTHAIVGAWHNDDNGPHSGCAYLFDISEPAKPIQTVKLLPLDGSAEDSFGNSVAISGTTAIVGAHWDDDNGFSSGSAYLFDTVTGQQISKLLPIDGSEADEFGESVAISGSTAIVGAWRHDDNGESSGAAYLFDATTGQQLFKLLPDDGTTNDNFGITVAINDSLAIIGASRDGNYIGSAYLFDLTTGKQITKLLANDGQEFDHFGESVAISGNTAIVGAWSDNDNGIDSGSAYLFDTTTGLQITKLLPSDGAQSDNFGFSVSISDTIALVGAYHDDENGDASGSAYLFDISDPMKPVEIIKLLPDDGDVADRFGFSVSISGDIAFAGAWDDGDNGNTSGSAYLFDTTTCLGDLDDDDIVGTNDLLILFAFWGEVDVFPKADLDGDGFVNTVDLLILFANWGPCS